MLQRQQELELERLHSEHGRQDQGLEHDLRMKQLQDQINVEQTMTYSNHRSALLEATKHVFSSLPLKEVKLVNFGGGVPSSANTTDFGLLPGLWAGVHS